MNEPRVDKVKYMLQYDYKGQIMLGLTSESNWVTSKQKHINTYCYEPASATFLSNEMVKQIKFVSKTGKEREKNMVLMHDRVNGDLHIQMGKNDPLTLITGIDNLRGRTKTMYFITSLNAKGDRLKVKKPSEQQMKLENDIRNEITNKIKQ